MSNNSDDDFDLVPRRHRTYQTHAGRLNAIIREARRNVTDSYESSFVSELGNRFPFANQSSTSRPKRSGVKRKKVNPWRVIPCCLALSLSNRVPTRGPLNSLCKKGLGTLWFCNEDKLEIPTYYTPQELSYLIVTLFPLLENVTYEFCKATGPGNNVLVPLSIMSSTSGCASSTRYPLLSSNQVKSQIGRKGRLYIRPCVDIDLSLIADIPEHQAYTPKNEVPCLGCGLPLLLAEISDHLYACDHSTPNIHDSPLPLLTHEEQPASVFGSGGQGQLGGAGVVLGSDDSPRVVIGIGGDGKVEGGPGVIMRSSSEGEDEDAVPEVADEIVLSTNSPSPIPVSDSDNEEHVEDVHVIIQQQNDDFAETLRTDQRQDWVRALEAQHTTNSEAETLISAREQQAQQQRIEQWYERIRSDLQVLLPPEPPIGTPGNISVRVRLPNGERVSRIFCNSGTIENLFNFVGCQNAVNPRHFRILLNEVPRPRQVNRYPSQLLTEAGFSPFTLVIVENTEVPENENAPQSVPITNAPENENAPQSVPVTNVNVSGRDAMDIVNAVDGTSKLIASPQELEEQRREIQLQCARKGSIFQISLNRYDILEKFLTIYEENPQLTLSEMRVRFDGERGVDGGGLVREAVALFWESFERDFLDGREEKVPVNSPRMVSRFYHVGRILSHGFVLSGYFPLCFSKPLVQVLVSENVDVSDDDLISSFLKHVDAFEADAITACFNGADPKGNDVILSMLARFNYHSVPTKEKFRSTILMVARFALVCQPYFAMMEMRRGMVNAHSRLWKKCVPQLAESLVYHLQPTSARVWSMIIEPEFHNPLQQQVFDYLRRFIHTLLPDDLAKFMRFVTGNPQCGIQIISVDFNHEENVIKRRPTSNTCGMILHLPVSYHSFKSFNDDFKCILNNSDLWQFDSV